MRICWAFMGSVIYIVLMRSQYNILFFSCHLWCFHILDQCIECHLLLRKLVQNWTGFDLSVLWSKKMQLRNPCGAKNAIHLSFWYFHSACSHNTLLWWRSPQTTVFNSGNWRRSHDTCWTTWSSILWQWCHTYSIISPPSMVMMIMMMNLLPLHALQPKPKTTYLFWISELQVYIQSNLLYVNRFSTFTPVF